MGIKAKTFKNVDTKVLDRFDEIKKRQLGETGTDTEAFEHIINKTFTNPVNTEVLEQENQSLKETNQLLNEQATQTAQMVLDLKKELEEANNKIAALLSQEPEIKEVEKIVPIELQANEFIVELPDDLLKKARKTRVLMRKDGKFNGTDDEFPNHLTNLSIDYFIKHKYEDAHDHKK